MKTIWAENPEIINEEINLLINNRYALTLYQKDAQAQTVKAFAIDDSNSETLLVFIADSQLNAKHDECLIFYQVHGQAIRCFKGQAKKTSMKAVAITFPPRNLHYPTPQSSPS